MTGRAWSVSGSDVELFRDLEHDTEPDLEENRLHDAAR